MIVAWLITYILLYVVLHVPGSTSAAHSFVLASRKVATFHDVVQLLVGAAAVASPSMCCGERKRERGLSKLKRRQHVTMMSNIII